MPAGADPGGTVLFGRSGSGALEIACSLACWIPASHDASGVPWVTANSDTGDRANKSRWRAERNCDGRLGRALTKAESMSMRVSCLPRGIASTKSSAETRSSTQGSSLESRAHPNLLLQAIRSEVSFDDLQICFVGHPVVVEVIPARPTVVYGEEIPIRNILGVHPLILISIPGT